MNPHPETVIRFAESKQADLYREVAREQVTDLAAGERRGSSWGALLRGRLGAILIQRRPRQPVGGTATPQGRRLPATR